MSRQTLGKSPSRKTTEPVTPTKRSISKSRTPRRSEPLVQMVDNPEALLEKPTTSRPSSPNKSPSKTTHRESTVPDVKVEVKPRSSRRSAPVVEMAEDPEALLKKATRSRSRGPDKGGSSAGESIILGAWLS